MCDSVMTLTITVLIEIFLGRYLVEYIKQVSIYTVYNLSLELRIKVK